MNARPARLSPVVGALLLLVLAVARGPLSRDVAPFDTTFVGARLAAHAALGEGPRYNPGLGQPQPRTPVASPLALALVTGATSLGADPVVAARGLALVAELVAAALLLLLLAHRPGAAIAAVVLLAAAPELGHVVGGGAAPPLAFAFVLLACAAGATGGSLLTGLAAGLAAAAAPEAALVLPGIWLTWRRSVEWLGREAFAFLLVVAPTAWAMHRFTGGWLPTPLTHGGSGSLWSPALPGLGALVLLPLAIAGALRGQGERSLRPLLVVGAFAAVPWLLVGRDLHPRAAYLPVAALVVPAAILLEPWVTRLATPARVVSGATAGLALVAVGVLVVPRGAPGLREQVWEPLASWAAEAELDGGTRLLASDIGFTGWFAGGVVQPAAREEAALVAQLLALQPEYLLLRTGREEIGALRSSGELARAWYPVRRFSVGGESALEPELSELSEHPADDYLLFRRRL